MSSRSSVPISYLGAALLALFAADNFLLLSFLGLSPLVTLCLILIGCGAIAFLAQQAFRADIRISWKVIAVAGAVALALFMLGGQGRFFYANFDWQVRDAILADMARYPWPYAYQIGDEQAILRAPIGLYLLPALAGGGWHELAMLASNTLRLTLLFALCWPLFGCGRDRWIGLILFLLFSGFDIFGTALYNQLGIATSWDHLEGWNFNNQYSSHITQAFWVPQHALAGWTCAAAFLLWRKNLVHIGFFAATIPLVAIWSPLAIMGAVPFAIFAGLTVLRNRNWGLRDVLLAITALAIALPALVYLQIDAARLGSSWRWTGTSSYLFLILFEVLPLVWPPLRARSTSGTDRLLLCLILGCLLLMPLYQIGASTDFQMRASIMPLALLAYLFAQWFSTAVDNWPMNRRPLIWGIMIVAIGAVTPLSEIRRAITWDATPKPLCSLVGIWNKQEGLVGAPYATYFARLGALPKFVGPIPVLAGGDDPQKCADRDWMRRKNP
jgi:hypothetical protein